MGVRFMRDLVRRLPGMLTKVSYQAASRFFPARLFERYRSEAIAAGIDKVYLVVSFDCDTPEDARVVGHLHSRLQGMGVRPVYAVPGATLFEDRDVYRNLSTEGAEFLNHGGAIHATRMERGYVSRTFYDRMSWEAIEEDVRRGHQDVLEVTGITPRGFRTPHFGSFQDPDGLALLHSLLIDLGYRYASSTMPRFALRHGPLARGFALPEFPVTGMARDPLTVLDSWNCFAAPDRRYSPSDYLEESRLIAEMMRGLGVGIINVYADPSHVHDREEFFGAIECFVGVAAPTTYSELLDHIPTE